MKRKYDREMHMDHMSIPSTPHLLLGRHFKLAYTLHRTLELYLKVHILVLNEGTCAKFDQYKAIKGTPPNIA